MKLLFTRCTKPHQLDIKLFADAGFAPAETTNQPDLALPQLKTKEEASTQDFKLNTGKKYQQLLVGVIY